MRLLLHQRAVACATVFYEFRAGLVVSLVCFRMRFPLILLCGLAAMVLPYVLAGHRDWPHETRIICVSICCSSGRPGGGVFWIAAGAGGRASVQGAARAADAADAEAGANGGAEHEDDALGRGPLVVLERPADLPDCAVHGAGDFVDAGVERGV